MQLIETIKQTVNVITDSHADQNPISAPVSIAISIDNKLLALTQKTFLH